MYSYPQEAFFRYRLISAPLFGGVSRSRNDDEDFRATFAAETDLSGLQLKSEHLELVGLELGLDFPTHLFGVSRYTAGMLREKAALQDGLLGEFGEALVFLLSETGVLDLELVRIVTYKKGKRKKKPFPQPDFLICKGDQTVGVLEVKSTEVLNYSELRDTTKKWTWPASCSRMKTRRKDALDQLGLTNNGNRRRYDHELVTTTEERIPFPAGEAEAVVVMARDGRLHKLRTPQDDPRYRTPKRCRNEDRTCWKCAGVTAAEEDTADLIVARMPNEPGRLPLHSPWGRAGTWFRAYQRWSNGLWAFDPFAVSSTISELWAASEAWLASLDDDEASEARENLLDYLVGVMHEHGLDLQVLGEFDAPAIMERLEQQAIPDEDAIPITMSPVENIAEEISAATKPMRIATQLEDYGTAVVWKEWDGIRIRHTTSFWWEEEDVESLLTRRPFADGSAVYGLNVLLGNILPEDLAEQASSTMILPIPMQVFTGEEATTIGFQLLPLALQGNKPVQNGFSLGFRGFLLSDGRIDAKVNPEGLPQGPLPAPWPE